jgi:tRNA pseudouridine13 synthase
MSERPAGRIRTHVDDFVVEEIPAYAPSGRGEHVFLRLTKTNRTTLDTVQVVARALGCDPRAAGFAGMKDKRAVCTQTVSLQTPRGVSPEALAEHARTIALEGVRIHEATPHPHKLKPGHLVGNRFAIAVRGVARERMDDVDANLARVSTQGVPNAFGAQRYGKGGDNATNALAWLRGEQRPPRDSRVRRLHWSALQSAIFDAVLRARIADGTWATPTTGDLLKLRSSGGLFLCADVAADRERALRGELSPTGPILGARMRRPEGNVADLESRIASATLGSGFDLASTRPLGEGSRRALRIWIEGLRHELAPGGEGDGGNAEPCIWVRFVLPKGAYATTVLAEAFDIHEAPRETGDADENLDPANVGERRTEHETSEDEVAAGTGSSIHDPVATPLRYATDDADGQPEDPE